MKECGIKIFSYFTVTYVVSTQKKRLIVEHPKHFFVQTDRYEPNHNLHSMDGFIWIHAYTPDFIKSAYQKKKNSYFSTKTYVVGTQKNRLNETVLLSTQNICLNCWVRKYLQFYAHKLCYSKPMIPQMDQQLSFFLIITYKCIHNHSL